MDEKLKTMLKRHEGVRLFPYSDTRGFTTIGCGRNLTQNGISAVESDLLLQYDISRCYKEAETFWWFKRLHEARQIALIDMLFNLGFTKFSQFKNMITAFERFDFAEASKEMLNSQWAKQVNARALELAHIIESGELV